MATTASTSERRRTPKQIAEDTRVQHVREILQAAQADPNFPLTANEIAARLAEPVGELLKLLAGRHFKSDVLLPDKKDPQAPVALTSDVDRLLNSARFHAFVAQRVKTKRQQTGKPLRSTIKSFLTDAKLDKSISIRFAEVLQNWIATRTLPDLFRALIECPLTPAELLDRCKQVVFEQRAVGTDHYPVAEAQLIKLVGCKATELKKVVTETAFREAVVRCDGVSSAIVYVARDDFHNALPRWMDLAISRLARKPGQPTTIRSAKDIASSLLKDRAEQAVLVADIERTAGQNRLRADLRWLLQKGTRLYFRLADLQPLGSTTPSQLTPAPAVTSPKTEFANLDVVEDSEIAALFEAAFSRVDARTGNRNFVKVYDLRQELPHVPRDQFDRGLRALRIADGYTMESAHGGAVRLTEEERQGGIQEGSSLLVYVSRK